MPETVYAIMYGGMIASIVVDDEPVMAVFGDYERAEQERLKLKNAKNLIVNPLEVIR